MKRFGAVTLGLLGLAAALAQAAQFKRYGGWEVHYVALNATALAPRVAERHGIVRGPNKGIVNISAVAEAGRGEQVKVEGSYTNLLGQTQALAFREIQDANADGGTAFYYLAAFDFPHAETLRFDIKVELPGHGAETFTFWQPLYRPAD